MDCMAFLAELGTIAQENNGIIETKTATKHGISGQVLSALCKKGEICRVGRGRYALYDDVMDKFLSVSLRYPKAVFSHETALYLNGAIDEMPYFLTVTLPASCYEAPDDLACKCNVVYIKTSLLELGKTTVEVAENRVVPVYNMERTICDIIRSVDEFGMDFLLDSLELFQTCGGYDLFTVMLYARKMHMYDELDEYMDALR